MHFKLKFQHFYKYQKLVLKFIKSSEHKIPVDSVLPDVKN